MFRKLLRERTGREPGQPRRSARRTLKDMSRANKRGSTFIIRVCGQQNATWQGSLSIPETHETIHFRSALELIRLMDEAIARGVYVENEDVGEV